MKTPEIDVTLRKGYALATDISPTLAWATAGVVSGVIAGYKACARTGDVKRAVFCGAWVGVHTFVESLIPVRDWGVIFLGVSGALKDGR